MRLKRDSRGRFLKRGHSRPTRRRRTHARRRTTTRKRRITVTINPKRRRKSRRRSRRNPAANPLYRSRSGKFTGRPTRRRMKRKRSGGWHGNPLLKYNRKHRRRGRRRSRRNPLRLFNPFGGVGSIVGKVVSKAKSVLAPRTLGQAAGGSVGFVASWAAPAYLVPQLDVGLQGIGLSAASAVLASIVVGMVAPAYAPVVLLGGLIGTVAKGLMQYARGVLYPQSGMAGFLTVTNGRMGQIPANLIAGTGRMGEFLEVRRPVSAIGPGSAAAFGAAGRYTNAS